MAPLGSYFVDGLDDWWKAIAGLGQQPTYDTQLSPEQEQAYQAWKQQNAPRDSGADYDLRGAFQAGVRPAGPEAGADAGHFPDTFKKPGHPTFSNQSQYAPARPDLAGFWQGENYIPPVAPSGAEMFRGGQLPPSQGFPSAQPASTGEEFAGLGGDPTALATTIKNWWMNQPSWAEKARLENQKSAEAFQQGGAAGVARQMVADTEGMQDLAAGFGGNIKGVKGRPPPRSAREIYDTTMTPKNQPPPPIGHNMPPEPITPPAPEPGRQYLTGPRGPKFREQTAAGAVDLAKTDPHIIPNENGVGFVGAPENVKNLADLQAHRAAFDKYVELGSRIGGQNWYSNARTTIGEITGAPPPHPGAKPMGHLAAQEYAAWSPQATPPVNQNWAIQAHNAYQMNQPLKKVRTGQQGQSYIEARRAGEDIKLGKKTGPYSESIDPTIPEPPTAANDIWHARALGYTKGGKPWKSALTESQHVYMDGETLQAARRASELGLGGDKNWTAQKVQAAGWIGKRAEDIFNKAKGKLSMEEALQRADVQYRDTIGQQTAFGTYEVIPGVGTGHLPEISTGSQLAREAYAADPRSAQTVPGAGGKPYDVIYNSMGIYQRPTIPTTGVFEKGGVTDVNPGMAARPVVSLTGKSGAREIDPASKKALSIGEALRSYFNVQNMGAANYMTPANRPGRSADIAFNPRGQLSPAEVDRLQAIGAKYDRPSLMHLGDEQAVLTNWGGTKPLSPKETGKLAADLGEAAAPVERVERQSVTQDFSKQFAEKNIGSGQATRKVFNILRDQKLMAEIDKSTQMRDMVRNMYERDEQLAKEGKKVRFDVQNARQIFIAKGLAGLKAAEKAGMTSLPAIAAFAAGLPALSAMMQEEQ